MAVTTEEFITHFHSLSGETIGEKKRNLHVLLNNVQRTNSHINFDVLRPQTILEEKFKLDALIFLTRTTELFDQLKTDDNPKLIGRILNLPTPWFLDEILQKFSADQLVAQLFPLISFNTKVKLLNKLCKRITSQEKGDELFSCVEKKYGLYLASRLLEACSANLIIRCVENYKIKPTPSQMLSIATKHPPELTKRIFGFLRSIKFSVDNVYKKVFVHLSRNNLDLYLELHTDYNLKHRLGRRTTSKVIKTRKSDVIRRAKTYTELLHNKQTIRSMGRDFDRFYFETFPSTLTQFECVSDQLFSTIENAPKNVCNVNILLATFRKAYGSEIWEHHKLVTPQLLELLPNEERRKFLKPEHKPEDLTEDQWKCYHPTDESIPYLKKRISFTSDIETRAKLIKMLVETCRINRDSSALTHVSKYILSQHRNDHISVRLGFLRALRKDYKLKNLTGEQWVYVKELLQLFTLNGEECLQAQEVVLEHLHYHLRHNLPITEAVTYFLKVSYDYSDWNILPEQPSYEKSCLLTIAQIYPSHYKKDTTEKFHWKFINSLVNWNRRHPRDPIDVLDYPGAFKAAVNYLRKDVYDYRCNTLTLDLMKSKIGVERKSEILSAYFSDSRTGFDFKLGYWLIKHDPLRLDPDRAVKMLDSNQAKNSAFWRFCRNYAHLGTPAKLIELIVKSLEGDPDGDDEAQNNCKLKQSIQALSNLMSAAEFRRCVSKYYPGTARVKNTTAEDKRIYAIQKFICSQLKNAPPDVILEICGAFHKGDYFKFTFPALFFISRNINEHKALELVADLMKSSVSSQKRAIRIGFCVLDRESIFRFINSLTQTQTNAGTIRHIILKCVIGFFVKNSDDYSWELVKSNANSIDDGKDTATLNLLIETEKIPQNYLGMYIRFVWEVLEKLRDADDLMELRKAVLLNAIGPDLLQAFPVSFCEDLITRHFFKTDGDKLTAFQLPVQRFVCGFVIHCEDVQEQERRLGLCFGILKDRCVARILSKNNEDCCEERVFLNRFVTRFCSEFLDGKSKHGGEVLVKFANLWMSVMKPHDSFSDYLQLKFTMIHFQRLEPREIGEKIGLLCDGLAEVYGTVFLPGFHDNLDTFFMHFLKSESSDWEERRVMILEGLVRPDSSVPCLILGLLILMRNRPTSAESKLKCEELIKICEAATNATVKIYLHFYISNRNAA